MDRAKHIGGRLIMRLSERLPRAAVITLCRPYDFGTLALSITTGRLARLTTLR